MTHFYLRPDGGYLKPTAYTPSLSAAKGSGTVVEPVCPPFAEHWKVVLSNLGSLGATVATAGVPFKGALDDAVSFKVKYEPFIKNDGFIDGDDADMDPALRLENVPVRGDIAPLELAAMKTTHVFNLLPAYDTEGDLILPKDYESRLKGATVAMSFALKHYDFPHRASSQASNTFVADIVKIRVLAPPGVLPVERVVRKRILAKDTDTFGSSSKRARTQG